MDNSPGGMLDDAARPTILVIDDDASLVDLLYAGLSGCGFQVWKALSVRQALDLVAGRGLPHLAIVDLLMQEENGIAFCKAIHEYSDLPCIILSCISDLATVVTCLEQEAEDYMVKPFKLAELVARVRRVLKRTCPDAYAAVPLTLVNETLSVEFPQRRAFVNGRPIRLTPTETKILHILLCHAGSTVPTEMLLHRLWPDEDVFEDALRVYIHRLRQKIEVREGRGAHIVTERNIGYRFER